MNKRLDDAVTEGLRIRQEYEKERVRREEIKAQQKQERIAVNLPRAKKWVEDNLYEKITRATVRGERCILVDTSKGEAGIDGEALRLALLEVSGIEVLPYHVEGYSDDGIVVPDHYISEVRW